MSKQSANVSIVNLSDGRQVCLSYGVIVAAFIPRDYIMTNVPNLTSASYGVRGGYIRTDARYSVTTSRHMNQFAGKDSPTIPHAELCALCAPVESRQ